MTHPIPDLDRHVKRMLAIAQERHPEFEEDCLTDPGLLVEHWERGDDLRFSYVENLDRDVVPEDPATMVDDSAVSDLSGLFTPALPPKRVNRIQVKYRSNDYTPRRNFTLLHEIGHYLQQTDDELVDTLCTFSSSYEERVFEEKACNRFASLALLPDDYMQKRLHALPRHHMSLHAADIRDLFEENRERRSRRDRNGRSSKNGRIRVSRPAIVRRLADFIAPGESISLIRDGELDVRVHGTGTTDYDDDLNEVERHVLRNFKNHRNSTRNEMLQQARFKDGRSVRFSAAASYGRYLYYFVVARVSEG